MFSLSFTWNKENVRALNPNPQKFKSQILKTLQNKHFLFIHHLSHLKFRRQNVFHRHFHIHVCSDSCYIDTHQYTRNHCRNKDMSRRCKTSYTSMKPIQEPTKK